jgi:hypothetical protein
MGRNQVVSEKSKPQKYKYCKMKNKIGKQQHRGRGKKLINLPHKHNFCVCVSMEKRFFVEII